MLQIGDSVVHERQRHAVLGFTPIGVTPPQIQIRDPRSGAARWLEWDPATGETTPPERATLSIVPDARAS
jgi:hypothetical protein